MIAPNADAHCARLPGSGCRRSHSAGLPRFRVGRGPSSRPGQPQSAIGSGEFCLRHAFHGGNGYRDGTLRHHSDLRWRCDSGPAALHEHNHGLRGRPGRRFLRSGHVAFAADILFGTVITGPPAFRARRAVAAYGLRRIFLTQFLRVSVSHCHLSGCITDGRIVGPRSESGGGY